MAPVIRARAALLSALLSVATAASAQQSPASVDPVVVHFREYRAALERNDLPAAEAAAAAALAASEAASGRRTAVLALNLANLRLELGDGRDALTPARTAHTLATASSESGVDPVAATLTLGRSELAAGTSAGAERVLGALRAADGNGALEADAYNAAVDLGRWSLEAKSYDTARTAWTTAAGLAHTTADPQFERARALTGQGVAIVLKGMDRAAPESVGTDGTFSAADARAARDAFANALALLTDGAFPNAAAAAGLTPGQLAYAQVLAWQAALAAKLQSTREASLPDISPPVETSGRCLMRTVRGDASIEYPPEVLDRYGVGAVVVHLGIDAGGNTTSRTIAAAIPPGTLANAVEEVMGEWRAAKDPRSPADCRIPSSVYVPVRFVLE